MPDTYGFYTNTAATTAAVTNRFMVSANMSLTPYTIANASPVWSGGCLVTITHTTVAGTDTLGTITIVGTDLAGAALTEVITPVADSTATSTKIFRTVTSATSLGWVATSTADTIVIGCAAGSYAAAGFGVLGTVLVNNSVAAAITIADKRGTIITVPASQAAGTAYGLHVQFVGYLKVSTTSTNDVTVTHTGTVPAFPLG
jgi:hypothetical protein